jgi:hypothetical protein
LLNIWFPSSLHPDELPTFDELLLSKSKVVIVNHIQPFDKIINRVLDFYEKNKE